MIRGRVLTTGVSIPIYDPPMYLGGIHVYSSPHAAAGGTFGPGDRTGLRVRGGKCARRGRRWPGQPRLAHVQYATGDPDRPQTRVAHRWLLQPARPVGGARGRLHRRRPLRPAVRPWPVRQYRWFRVDHWAPAPDRADRPRGAADLGLVAATPGSGLCGLLVPTRRDARFREPSAP